MGIVGVLSDAVNIPSMAYELNN